MAAPNVTLHVVTADFCIIVCKFALSGQPPNKDTLRTFLQFFDCMSPGDSDIVIVFLKTITYFMKEFCYFHRILACDAALQHITGMMEQNPSQEVQVALEEFRILQVLIKQKMDSILQRAGDRVCSD
jgi:hypothetical protein